jgi:NADH:ubiquinone oxidoreductase subunit 4 (subunit M)
MYGLPTHLESLGERWIFYLKMGAIAWMSASLLYTGQAKWVLAVLGFVVSVHCYSPMAWHTVDGIFFGATACFLFFNKQGRYWAILSGIALAAAVLCKQSFYPFPFIFLTAAFISRHGRTWYAMTGMLGAFVALDMILFYVFWELALIPIYLICLVWGGENRGKITFKFFVYTLFGSLFMLIGLIYLYNHTGLEGIKSWAINDLYQAGRNLSAEQQGVVFWLMRGSFSLRVQRSRRRSCPTGRSAPPACVPRTAAGGAVPHARHRW